MRPIRRWMRALVLDDQQIIERPLIAGERASRTNMADHWSSVGGAVWTSEVVMQQGVGPRKYTTIGQLAPTMARGRRQDQARRRLAYRPELRDARTVIPAKRPPVAPGHRHEHTHSQLRPANPRLQDASTMHCLAKSTTGTVHCAPDLTPANGRRVSRASHRPARQRKAVAETDRVVIPVCHDPPGERHQVRSTTCNDPPQPRSCRSTRLPRTPLAGLLHTGSQQAPVRSKCQCIRANRGALPMNRTGRPTGYVICLTRRCQSGTSQRSGLRKLVRRA